LKKGDAKEDIPKNEKISEFLLFALHAWKGSIVTFLTLSTRRKPKEFFCQYFHFTGAEDSTSCLHGVGLECCGNVHEE
jgi:hypothetical protein